MTAFMIFGFQARNKQYRLKLNKDLEHYCSKKVELLKSTKTQKDQILEERGTKSAKNEKKMDENYNSH